MKKLLLTALLLPSLALAEDITIQNLVRAETDHMIRANMAAFDFGVGQFRHLREPTTTENQPIIRMNQDTLYSGLVLDLSKPAEVVLPEIGGRYQSMLVVSQDHYMIAAAEPGTYPLNEDNVGTRFAYLAFRTFVDVGDEGDITAAHAAQDAIELRGGGAGPFEAPDWNLETLAEARKSINDLAASVGFNARYAFGSKEQVRPIDHLIGAISGWGGLPPTSAMYEMNSVPQNDGETHYMVTVKDVPVDAFWSLTVYNADGYLEPNDMGRNSLNNFSAQPNDDGSYTLHFGGCEDGRVNCIPISPDWNYAIRLYEPRQEIIDGTWEFPSIEPINP